MGERRRDLCWCPMLAAAKETDQLASAAGVRVYGGSAAAVVLAATLRDKYGCPGSGRGRHAGCYWASNLLYLENPHPDDEHVPEIRPRKNDGPGVYL
jgi:hypothetical protein